MLAGTELITEGNPVFMKYNQPLIGITPQYEKERERVWIRQSYTEAVIRGGGIPVLLDQYADRAVIAKVVSRMDGILLTGGVDLHPRLYGEEIDPMCGEITEIRDIFELALLDALAVRAVPVLGICRGIQTLNVHAGGSLHQHLPDHKAVRHGVSVIPGTRLYDILGKAQIDANSYHHQAVKTPAPGFTVSAYASDGTIEAIERPGSRFYIGVQWHPELLTGETDHAALFRAFVRAAADG